MERKCVDKKETITLNNMCKGLVSRRLTDTHTRAQKVVQDVHHCLEISSHNMCRLYNTAGIASAAATATAALPAAVRSRRRLCGAGCTALSFVVDSVREKLVVP
jgi:hypothetical protein